MILFANEADIDGLVRLWEEAFGEDELVRDFYDKAFSQMSVLVLKSEYEIISMLHYIPCRCKQDGVFYNGAYLYALATDKRHRGQGHMGRLIEKALEFAKTSGVDFVFLVPASGDLYDYYGKFGFNDMLYRADECNLHFSQIIEEYVELEIATFGREKRADNVPCGAICFVNPAVRIEKINGLVPF